MAKERCRVCGKKVRVQIQKNTGYCTPTCKELQEEENERAE